MAYIPSKDADLVNWGNNFATLITADPPRYGLQASDASVIQSNFDEFQTAYGLATDPATRTIVTVAAKDEEKAGFLSLARSYAAIIRANQGVSNDDKVALGLNIPDPTPTPIPAPTSYPVLTIPLAGVGQQYLSVADQFTPTTKAKPFGVAGMLLYRKVGATPAVNMDGAEVIGIVTRADSIISTAGVTAGQITSYAGKWFNRKGELGPLSAITSQVAF